MRLAAFILVAVLLLAATVGGTLVLTGQVALPWSHHAPARRPVPPDSVMVPMSIRPMKAYTRVSRADLLVNGVGQPQMWPESPAAMASADPPIERISDVLNRVLRRDKAAGYVFHESDFFPPGTSAGEAAGVPPGKRAITFEASDLTGVGGLAAGDHVDLVATQPIDLTKARQELGGPLPPGVAKTAGVQQVATDAVVVVPLTTRQVPFMTSAGLTSAQQVRTKPVQEVTIAVDASEVPGVEQAVGAGASIACLLRSGQPTSRSANSVDGSTTSAGPLPDQYTTVEQIVGDRHTYKYLPSGGRP